MAYRCSAVYTVRAVWLYLMLAGGWAVIGITGIGILAAGFNISLIMVIFGLPPGTHLPAKEHHNPDEERAAHDQGRRQRLQIGEHAGLQPCCGSFPALLLAL